MDNKELIVRAKAYATPTRYNTADAPIHELVRGLADALEAAEAELTRRATVIADALAAIECVPLMDDRYGTHVDRKVLFDILAAAPVSLEAVKAETTTEWGVRYKNLADEPVYVSHGDEDPRASSELSMCEGDVLVSREVTDWRPVETEGHNRA